MHSYWSDTTQPFATASYPIFVAGVASTFSEALLIDNMLKTITDPAVKLSLLGNHLEGIKGTVFRPTQFGAFELRAHEMMEKGQTLAGDALDALYADITKRYYGARAGRLYRRRLHRP
jgi:oligoendopeptidase F